MPGEEVMDVGACDLTLEETTDDSAGTRMPGKGKMDVRAFVPTQAEK